MSTETQGKALTQEELLAKYDRVGPFREGLAWACKNNQEFHIRPDGTPAYEARYDYVGSFRKGLAWTRKGGEGFHIRPDGTRVN